MLTLINRERVNGILSKNALFSCENRRSNKLITHNSKTQTISQWSDETGLSRRLIGERIRYGWNVERALNKLAS